MSRRCVAGRLAGEVTDDLERQRLGAAALRRGETLLDAGRLEDAAGALRAAIVLVPKDPDGYRRLAEAEFKRGDIDGAVLTYRKLLAIYPYQYVALLYWELAIAELSAGRLVDARLDLLQAADLDPTEWRPHYFLGIVYHRLGDIPSARAEWRHVLALNPGNREADEQLRKLDSARP